MSARWVLSGTNRRHYASFVEEGGFVYDADAYNDDLPFYEQVNAQTYLVENIRSTRMICASHRPRPNSGTQFFDYLKDAFDVLYAEGEAQPKMLSIGLHCRLAGRPARAASLKRFIEYIQGHERVWCARRIDIARHWLTHFPPG